MRLLKRQNLRVGGYTENLLKWFNYSCTRTHPWCEVSCHGTEWTCNVSSCVIRRGQPDSGENCIVLQSRLTRSLVGQNAMNEAMDRRVRTFDAWCHAAQSASEQLQLCELPLDSLRKNLAWWAVTRRSLKNHKTGDKHLPGTIWYSLPEGNSGQYSCV